VFEEVGQLADSRVDYLDEPLKLDLSWWTAASRFRVAQNSLGDNLFFRGRLRPEPTKTLSPDLWCP
jgi:hypothetical protein